MGVGVGGEYLITVLLLRAADQNRQMISLKYELKNSQFRFFSLSVVLR